MNKPERKDLALVTKGDLDKAGGLALNEKQLELILKATPDRYKHKRPAKGGGEWTYVTGGYVKKMLNLMFGWDWDFEIVNQMILHGEAIVQGKLTCRADGRVIIKMQFGNKDIVYKKQKDEQGERVPLSIGNDLKAAATDALKKCAAEIGIAADVYNAQDFQALRMVITEDITVEDLEILRDAVEEHIPANEIEGVNRIISKRETESYAKLYKYLNNLNR